MKNVFKFLGIAFVACSMLVACGDDTETYKITVKANPADAGTVTGGGKYESGATATLEATPNAGYKFVNWEDNSTNNPRLVTVTADAEYVANFAPNSGVSVTFGTTTWDAQYINAQMSGSAINVAAAQTNSNSYPIANLFKAWESGSPAAGTFNAAPEMTVEGQSVNISFGNPYLWYFESGSWDLNGSDGSTIHTGDWWAKNITLNISALDADAMTASMVVNATMAHVTEMVNAEGYLTTVDFNDCTAKDATMTVTNQTFTAGSKVMNVKGAFAKLAK